MNPTLLQQLQTAATAVDAVNADVLVTNGAQAALTAAQSQQNADVAAAATDIGNATAALAAALAALPTPVGS